MSAARQVKRPVDREERDRGTRGRSRSVRCPDDEGIGLRDVLHGVTMQVFIRDPLTMIAASIQCDVDGISKRSHHVFLKRSNETELSRGERERV